MIIKSATENRVLNEGAKTSAHVQFGRDKVRLGNVIHQHDNKTSQLDNRHVRTTRNKLLRVIVASLAVMSLSIGVVGWYFQSHSLPLTTVGRFSLGNKTDEQIKSVLRSGIEQEVIKIQGMSSSLTPPGRDLGITYDVDATVLAVHKSRGTLAWWQKVTFWRHNYNPVIVYINEAKLQKYFDDNVTKPISDAKNAVLAIDTNGTIKIEQEADGQKSGVRDAARQILSATMMLRSVTLPIEKYSVKPAISVASLEATKSKLTSMLDRKLVVKIGDDSVQITRAAIVPWLVLSPNEAANSYDVAIDDGQIAAYIDDLARAHAAPPKAELVVIDPETRAPKVLSQGRSGTDVSLVGKSSVAVHIKEALEKNIDIEQNLDVVSANYETVAVTEYPKWIEVDITNKRLYAYEYATLVKTILVSAGAPATPTVKGTYAITSKFRSQNMQGLNADGTKYFQPGVEYVNYFYQDYAIHGNYWRPLSYFGNVNSSHGCVGMVNTDAKFVYDWAPIGTAIVVHD